MNGAASRPIYIPYPHGHAFHHVTVPREQRSSPASDLRSILVIDRDGRCVDVATPGERLGLPGDSGAEILELLRHLGRIVGEVFDLFLR